MSDPAATLVLCAWLRDRIDSWEEDAIAKLKLAGERKDAVVNGQVIGYVTECVVAGKPYPMCTVTKLADEVLRGILAHGRLTVDGLRDELPHLDDNGNCEEPSMTMTETCQSYGPYSCQGFLGEVFGHKFTYAMTESQYCYRCGMPKGGWRPENETT